MATNVEVFFSHSTHDLRDSNLAHKLAEGLASQGVKVWIAPESIPAGEQWEPSLVTALVERCTHFLVIISESSVRSAWVLKEIAMIRKRAEIDRTVKVLPLRVGKVGSFEHDQFLRTFQDLRYSPQFSAQLKILADTIGLPPLLPSVFRNLIEETTKYFVGREQVFAAIQQFVSREQKGAFMLVGAPGMGKTTILAEYVRRTGCPAHFNIGPAGIDTAEQFLHSIESQLRTNFNVVTTSHSGENPSIALRIAELLEKAAEARPEGEPLVIAIDALDEVKVGKSEESINILHLPPVLSRGVFLLLSGRVKDYRFVTREPQVKYDLNQDLAQNQHDIELYLTKRLGDSAFAPWLEAKKWPIERAVSELATRSENNFMYLHYVLQELERGNFQDPKEQFPIGLQGYYSDHWHRMGMTNRSVSQLRLDVLQILALVRGSVSAQLISDVVHTSVAEVRAVLNDWQEFLQTTYDDGSPRYRLYHSSFQDFLLSKEAIQDLDPKRWATLLADHFAKEFTEEL